MTANFIYMSINSSLSTDIISYRNGGGSGGDAVPYENNLNQNIKKAKNF